jgi:single-strand DNA-binding protein
MNEITIHGNLTATPTLRHGHNGEGTAFATFSVAVNRRYYSGTKGGWVDLPTVFHQVIARYELAENLAVSLAKGTTVTVTGYFADNSYLPAGSEQTVRQQRIEATDVAVSLRFATAVVTKRTRGDNPAPAAEPAEPAAEAADAAAPVA